MDGPLNGVAKYWSARAIQLCQRMSHTAVHSPERVRFAAGADPVRQRTFAIRSNLPSKHLPCPGIRALRGVPVNAASQSDTPIRHPIECTSIRNQHLPAVGNLDAVFPFAGIDNRTWAATGQPVVASAKVDGHPDARIFTVSSFDVKITSSKFA